MKVRRFTTVKWTLARQSSMTVTNFGGKRRFGSRHSQRAAAGHGGIGNATGLGKELGLVYIVDSTVALK